MALFALKSDQGIKALSLDLCPDLMESVVVQAALISDFRNCKSEIFIPGCKKRQKLGSQPTTLNNEEKLT